MVFRSTIKGFHPLCCFKGASNWNIIPKFLLSAFSLKKYFEHINNTLLKEKKRMR
jgi:hypothetical protein